MLDVLSEKLAGLNETDLNLSQSDPIFTVCIRNRGGAPKPDEYKPRQLG